MSTVILRGEDAIHYAELHHLSLNKHADGPEPVSAGTYRGTGVVDCRERSSFDLALGPQGREYCRRGLTPLP